MRAFVVKASGMGSELTLNRIGPSREVKESASPNIWTVMDEAGFWGVLTRLSAFSYTAKALILISLFPSGPNLWSDIEDFTVDVCVHMCLQSSKSKHRIYWHSNCRGCPQSVLCFMSDSGFLAWWHCFLCAPLWHAHTLKRRKQACSSVKNK